MSPFEVHYRSDPIIIWVARGQSAGFILNRMLSGEKNEALCDQYIWWGSSGGCHNWWVMKAIICLGSNSHHCLK